jgi:two-component system LytT family response regulator
MHAIIIDDEAQSRDALANLLKMYCPNVTLLGTASDGESGLDLVRLKKPQVIFLDVEMPDMDGFEVLKRLGQPDACVVFVTAHNVYAVQAFEMAAIDYLLKPVSGARLVQAVHKANEQYQRKTMQTQYELLLDRIHQQGNPVSADSRIAFSMLNEIVFSWVRNIIWIEAKASMCFVSLSDHQKELFIAKNIGEYAKLFVEYKDLKLVHRSHIANRNHVKRYLREENTLEMSDGKHIPVSSDRRGEVMDWLGLH